MREACRDHSKGLRPALYALPEVRGTNAKVDLLSRDSVQRVRFLQDRLREQTGRFRRIEGREQQREQDGNEERQQNGNEERQQNGNEERQQVERMMEMSRFRQFKKRAD